MSISKTIHTRIPMFFIPLVKIKIMTSKLNLTIEQTVIEKAKKYALKKESSLSGIIENYLIAITKEDKNTSNELSPRIKALKGSFKLPDNFDYKKELSDRLAKKYL